MRLSHVGCRFDEDIRTWWSAASNDPGEWLSVDLGEPVTLHALQINFADQDSTIVGRRATPEDSYKYFVEYAITPVHGDTAWLPIPELDLRANTLDRPHNYVQLAAPLRGVTKLRITNVHMPGGSKFSLSGLRAFGRGSGTSHSPPRRFFKFWTLASHSARQCIVAADAPEILGRDTHCTL